MSAKILEYVDDAIKILHDECNDDLRAKYLKYKPDGKELVYRTPDTADYEIRRERAVELIKEWGVNITRTGGSLIGVKSEIAIDPKLLGICMSLLVIDTLYEEEMRKFLMAFPPVSSGEELRKKSAIKLIYFVLAGDPIEIIADMIAARGMCVIV